MPPAVEVAGLVRRFRRGRRTLVDRLRRAPDQRVEFAAVDGIDFDVGVGELFAVLGPNGAGKSTTIRMIATLLEPTEGQIRVGGVDAVRDPDSARRRLGVALGGERSVYWKLTARENLRYFAALQGVPTAAVAARVDQALAEVELAERADDYVERFSTGMRQRLVIARALIGDPDVLLLDEPTSGLDPQASRHLCDRLRALCAAGRTILLATHDMAEADQIADRVAVIDHGRLVALDRPDKLKKLLNAESVARVDLGVPAGGSATALVADVASFAVVAEQLLESGTLSLTLHVPDMADLLPRLVGTAGSHGATVLRVEAKGASLEDAFLALTGREPRE